MASGSDTSVDVVEASTCGVCMSKVNRSEIVNHKCCRNWHSVTIDANANIFYPTNQKGNYLAKMICNNKEQLVLINNKENGQFSFENVQINKEVVAESDLPTNDCCISGSDSQESFSTLDKSTLEEMLILEVRNRPPLYDYTLPLSVRGRYKIAELWKEISDALQGLMSPEEAKKRWKSLKDTYSKIVAEEKKPSGSARSCSQKPF
ncbi:PREDICTED: uncharacterized protein LOC105556705 [Vollenhovia emeryi]|uniref:uncharacterized protein LOC105556705 n=1 Tax=Vollenhovia emeryi TaxID=411798 RepID=UPI0005F41A51|nr:PREDICTED: uncharacterized protein LOC105556705 [Vollenhovia emeryi]